MKVLLLQDVAGVGQKNDVVEAKDGYARNFLLPKKLAVVYKGQAVKIKEGLAKAKEDGRYKGRKPTARAKADEVVKMTSEGMTKQKIADDLSIGIASVYRILKADKQ